MHVFAVKTNVGPSAVVDIFTASSKIWSTASLSVARWELAAASLPLKALAFFGGGQGIGDFPAVLQYTLDIAMHDIHSASCYTFELTVLLSLQSTLGAQAESLISSMEIPALGAPHHSQEVEII